MLHNPQNMDKHASRIPLVAAYSGTHFLVDFAGAFLMFRFIAGSPDAYLCVLLYNFCAFAMQMPLGIIADRLNRNYIFAMAGCLLVVASFGFIAFPVIAVVIIGIGNAMFHLGGGIDVLNISDRKLGALGVFVSPGALGVYLGTIFGKGNDLHAAFFPVALIAAAALIFVIYKGQRGGYPKNPVFSLGGVRAGGAAIAIICFFIVVCLRSYAGLNLDFTWKGEGYWGIALICAVVLGKTFGGFAADRFGIKQTAVFSLGLAALLFLFPLVAPAGTAALFLFNMTMPITLFAMARLFPCAKGFAFGILTFGLFLGFLPGYLGVSPPAGAGWLFTLLAAISLALLFTGLRRAKL